MAQRQLDTHDNNQEQQLFADVLDAHKERSVNILSNLENIAKEKEEHFISLARDVGERATYINGLINSTRLSALNTINEQYASLERSKRTILSELEKYRLKIGLFDRVDSLLPDNELASFVDKSLTGASEEVENQVDSFEKAGPTIKTFQQGNLCSLNVEPLFGRLETKCEQTNLKAAIPSSVEPNDSETSIQGACGGVIDDDKLSFELQGASGRITDDNTLSFEFQEASGNTTDDDGKFSLEFQHLGENAIQLESKPLFVRTYSNIIAVVDDNDENECKLYRYDEESTFLFVFQEIETRKWYNSRSKLIDATFDPTSGDFYTLNENRSIIDRYERKDDGTYSAGGSTSIDMICQVPKCIVAYSKELCIGCKDCIVLVPFSNDRNVLQRTCRFIVTSYQVEKLCVVGSTLYTITNEYPTLHTYSLRTSCWNTQSCLVYKNFDKISWEIGSARDIVTLFPDNALSSLLFAFNVGASQLKVLKPDRPGYCKLLRIKDMTADYRPAVIEDIHTFPYIMYDLNLTCGHIVMAYEADDGEYFIAVS